MLARWCRTILLGLTLVSCVTAMAMAQEGNLLVPAKPSSEMLIPKNQPDEPRTVPVPDFKTQTGIPQGLNLETEKPQNTPSNDIAPEDIPDILMAEVNEVEKYCTNNIFYSAYHDCRCIAVKFLDARLKSDPDRSKDSIYQKVSSECPNEPGIAGMVYKSCSDLMRYSRPEDFDAFCTCTANRVARDYTKRPSMNMRYIDNLRKRALIACGVGQKPATANSPYLER